MIKSLIAGIVFLFLLLIGPAASSQTTNNLPRRVSLEFAKEFIDELYGKENIDCIIEATYFENRSNARNNGVEPIVEVIVNRFENRVNLNSFCEVVRQPFQFSYFNPYMRNGTTPTLRDKQSVELITKIVYFHLYKIHIDSNYRFLRKNTMHYDGTHFEQPDWAHVKCVDKVIGGHVFYFNPPRGSNIKCRTVYDIAEQYNLRLRIPKDPDDA